MVKVRVSYEYPEELQEVIARLGRNDVKRVRYSSVQEPGRFSKAYIELDNLCLRPVRESGIIPPGK